MMQAKAKSKYVRISPYKLRPFADAIRGRAVSEAVAYLKTYPCKRTVPLLKLVHSAYANAHSADSESIPMDECIIKEIRVDQGPAIRYFRPAAMGRAARQTKRLSHIAVIIEKK